MFIKDTFGWHKRIKCNSLHFASIDSVVIMLSYIFGAQLARVTGYLAKDLVHARWCPSPDQLHHYQWVWTSNKNPGSVQMWGESKWCGWWRRNQDSVYHFNLFAFKASQCDRKSQIGYYSNQKPKYLTIKKSKFLKRFKGGATTYKALNINQKDIPGIKFNILTNQ
jgi:hypothetical protein